MHLDRAAHPHGAAHLDRAEHLAAAWGSELVNVGEKGHINVAAGYGAWPEGLEYLRRLDNLA